MSDQLLTARRLAEQLSVSTETVLRWSRRGDLPAIKLPGGAVRFRVDALDLWLTERELPAASLTPLNEIEPEAGRASSPMKTADVGGGRGSS
jgi:excisionase family DNA binding protein